MKVILVGLSVFLVTNACKPVHDSSKTKATKPEFVSKSDEKVTVSWEKLKTVHIVFPKDIRINTTVDSCTHRLTGNGQHPDPLHATLTFTATNVTPGKELKSCLISAGSTYKIKVPEPFTADPSLAFRKLDDARTSIHTSAQNVKNKTEEMTVSFDLVIYDSKIYKAENETRQNEVIRLLSERCQSYGQCEVKVGN